MPQTSLQEILGQIRSLEPFPRVVTWVLDIASRDELIPNELIEVIQTDPGITARVLRVSNSAFYGCQGEIASLKDAGNLLGVSTLVNLVLTCAASNYFRQQGSAAASGQDRLWQCCLTHAVASRLLAERHGRTDPEVAYTAGLLQHVGSLVLDRFYDDGRVFIDTAVRNGDERIDAERKVLGMSHAEIGARLLSRWDMPHALVDTVRFHHKPDQASIDPVLASTTHLAETVGAARIAEEEPDALAYNVSDAALRLTGLGPGDFDVIEVQLRNGLRRATEMLAAA